VKRNVKKFITIASSVGPGVEWKSLMLRCQCPSVCPSVLLSVTEVHWRIIANLDFKFPSKFTAHCSRGEG